VSFGTALMPGTSGSLTVNDTSVTPGTLILAASNSYTGGTTITAGEIKLSVLPDTPDPGILRGQRIGRGPDRDGGHAGPERPGADGGALNGGAGARITDNRDPGTTPLNRELRFRFEHLCRQHCQGPVADLSLHEELAAARWSSAAPTRMAAARRWPPGTLILASTGALADGGSLTVDAGASLLFYSVAVLPTQ